MFETKEKIKKLEGQVAALKTYCTALDEEQEELYNAITKGLKVGVAEMNNINKEFYEAKDKRRKAFESAQGLFRALM